MLLLILLFMLFSLPVPHNGPVSKAKILWMLCLKFPSFAQKNAMACELLVLVILVCMGTLASSIL